MNGHDVLRETATLIGKGWGWGADARDSFGLAVAASDPAATAWSLPGAPARVFERPDADLAALGDALWGISGVIPDASLEGWNDAAGRSQDEACACRPIGAVGPTRAGRGRQPPCRRRVRSAKS